MKSLTINETLSIDSTLESPSKPHSEKPPTQHKNLFLVQCLDEIRQIDPMINESSSIHKKTPGRKNSKIKKRGKNSKKPKKNEKIEMHMLDFDSLLKSIIAKPKKKIRTPKVKPPCGSKKKLLGTKRKRQNKIIDSKSKYHYY